jgi:hypothetical protein
MTSQLNRKLMAGVLTAALFLPATTAFGNDWSKRESRTRGTAIGAAAGAFLGPPGVVVGAAVGNGVQAVRHSMHRHRTTTTHYRHHRSR